MPKSFASELREEWSEPVDECIAPLTLNRMKPHVRKFDYSPCANTLILNEGLGDLTTAEV